MSLMKEYFNINTEILSKLLDNSIFVMNVLLIKRLNQTDKVY